MVDRITLRLDLVWRWRLWWCGLCAIGEEGEREAAADSDVDSPAADMQRAASLLLLLLLSLGCESSDSCDRNSLRVRMIPLLDKEDVLFL